MKVLLKAFITLGIIILPVFTSKIERFKTINQFYNFYDDWVKSVDANKFQRIQDEWISMMADKSVNPCEDFYEFACGNYKRAFNFIKTDLPKFQTPIMREGVPAIAETVMFQVLHRILASDIHKNDNSMLKKTKLFYQSCVNSDENDYNDLQDHIKNLAAWPALTKNWDESQFDWVNVSAATSTINLGSFMWSRVELHNGVRVNAFGKFNGHYLTTEQIKTMKGLNYPFLSKMHLPALMEFSAELANIKSDTFDRVTFTLGELKKVLPNIDFQKYLRVVHGSKYIPDTEVVIIRDWKYFHDLSNVLLQTDVETIANFMLIDYLVKTSGPQIKLSDSPEVCAEMIYKLFVPVPALTFMDEYKIKEDSVEQTLDIFNQVREEAKRAASKWTLDTKRINRIDGYYMNLPHYSQLKDMISRDMESVHVNGSNFIQSLLNVMKYKNKQYVFDPGYGSDWRYPFDVKLVTDTSKLSIKSSFATFLPPLFHRYGKLSMKYSGVGEVLSQKLIDEFIDTNVTNSLTDLVNCYFSQYKESKRFIKDAVKDTLRKVEALNAAYKAYYNQLRRHQKYRSHERNPLHLNERQSFFLAFAQRTCGSYQRPRRDKSYGYADVMDILSNSVEFNAAFNCPRGSKMSPKKYC